MGTSKKQQQRSVRQTAPTRSRMTRSKGKAVGISDPAQNTQQLTAQLRSMGLYPAHTVGDGNCLFRALSDQLYGTPSYHLQLRKEICDWIEGHAQRYEPFCEDERGLAAHLRCMREQGTYGGHLELSSFSHLKRRDVKVIQPGLVYVIEWAAGGDIVAAAEDSSDSKPKSKRKHQQEGGDEDMMAETGPVYVAYHDWEHFSSIRNLRGPHTGLPQVVEMALEAESSISVASSPRMKPPSVAKARREAKAESRVLKRTQNGRFAKKSVKEKKAAKVVEVEQEESTMATPAQIPLPDSRSPSPLSSLSSSSSPHSSRVDMLEPAAVSLVREATLLADTLRSHRSPKRSFDESSSGASTTESVAKRTRSSRKAAVRPPDEEVACDGDQDHDQDNDDPPTPGLSTPDSSAASTRSSSVASSIPTPPARASPPTEPEPDHQRTLTKRERKALGLPRPRAALVAKRTGAGKIVIPGGRYKRSAGTASKPVSVDMSKGDEDEGDEEEDGEWLRNGTGRVDVRGFRELRI
ncbi:cysteine proteinase [Coniophora puteana RWD-64-598 SS2]|uniref:Cysteine proteinase n=1 Tax=Coniophora puteana (strain RWD-64-598) TaxID=741705 RepID=A0A5M3M845_CONPW|nr:cysteine proteinase [Coniophora puteana RWD-64-598 SS2]EIW74841.1 cysteine proteinase [Coniophora puteana RWD-64-598 SS2]